MRILVTGSRHYGIDDAVSRYEDLKRELLKTVYTGTKMGLPLKVTIIHGGARGADTLAGEAAKWFGWDCEVYPADWKTHGKAAGPIRNKQMLDEGKPDLVLAFLAPNSRGTANMIKQAKDRNVPVEIINI